ncbi:MAG: type II toxin-antitoxin system RelE/ParE family toxin [Methanospirillaceae archaeon]|nr:type II toxin-antitoxin system RelE/ParE family toxin [Methanospirillaceae archaeon]
MSKFHVRLTAVARRDFKKLPLQIRGKFWNDLRILSNEDNPKCRLDGLKGYPGIYKIRAGEFRLILEIIDNELVILVIEAGPGKTISKISGLNH